MFKLKVIQALYGDSLIVEAGTEDERAYLLIDGGPGGVYTPHLKKELTEIRDSGGKINLAMLSHVDADHVAGLLDLFNDLIKQRKKGQVETIAIEGLWHNAFGVTQGETAEKSLAHQLESLPKARALMPLVEKQVRSINQGQELVARARGLEIPINAEFHDTSDRVICVDNLNQPVQLENLAIRVIGPSRTSLQALQKDWEAWLAKQKKASEIPTPEIEAAARDLDQTVPNLSSIMLLVEAEGKSMLLTGDGRGDQLMEGMKKAGVLNADGTCHVDVFKLPHHGSARNVTPELLEHITADTYVISANGKDDNPDFQTLEWLVQAADRQKRSFTIVATNETPSIKAMIDQYDPATYHYRLLFIPPKAHSITLDLCAPI
jgi:beta-lactamase superfamily II metal-dependent hydrolase